MHTCPCCGNANWIDRYVIKPWHIKECSSCRFARIDSYPQKENRSEFYTEEKIIDRFVKKRTGVKHVLRRLKYFFNGMARRDKQGIFVKKVSRYVPEGGKVFDLGCGDGAFLEKIRNRYECSGVEMSDYLALQATEKKKLNVITGDFLSVNFNGEKFDAITSISVIEHMDSPAEKLQKCFDLLNPGGVLILKTVNYGCLNRKVMKEKWTGLRPPDHVVYFDAMNLKKMLSKIGFKKVRQTAWLMNDNMYIDAWK